MKRGLEAPRCEVPSEWLSRAGCADRPASARRVKCARARLNILTSCSSPCLLYTSDAADDM
eukprot:12241708-Alexandrium_andersonii.AAC.1